MKQEKAFVWFMSAAAGFVSLAMEIAWMRVAGFQNGNTPQLFGVILGLFLLGIVFGAMFGKYCSQTSRDDAQCARYGAYALLLGGIVDCASPVLVAIFAPTPWIVPLIYFLVVLTATCKAVVFPIFHHLGRASIENGVGRSVSVVYFFNIVGSSIAPLLVGFVALDRLGVQATIALLGAGAIMVSILWLARLARKLGGYGVSAVVFAVIGLYGGLSGGAMLPALAKGGAENIGFFLENRHGVIHSVKNDQGEQTVFGGNVYDGMMTADPVLDANMIHRVYWLSALHPAPQRILVVGFSGGAWTEVLRHFPSVQHIDVVEINSGYVDLVREQAKYRDVLSDQKIDFHFDDGRRWLRANPELKFDLIVMNNTFHWRAYSTNLLSYEFMTILKGHMAPQGVLAFNATGSPDALKTAGSVFPYAYRWVRSNFVYAGNQDFRVFDKETALFRLMELLAAVPGNEKYSRERLQRTAQQWVDGANAGLSTLENQWISADVQETRAKRSLEVITDRNMISEFRYGRDRAP